eukprot:1199-Heterococcus_DN1.PRE.4
MCSSCDNQQARMCELSVHEAVCCVCQQSVHAALYTRKVYFGPYVSQGVLYAYILSSNAAGYNDI